MKSVVRLTIVTLVLCVTEVVFGQISNMRGTVNRPLRVSEQYKETEGSPYYFEEYMRGKIKDKDGEVKEVALKYDTYREEVEILVQGSVLIIDKDFYPEFTMEVIDEDSKKVLEYRFTNDQYKLPGLKPNKYSRELFVGEKATVVKVTDTILVINEDTGYGGGVQNNRFEKRDLYFVGGNGKEFVNVKLNHNAILKALKEESGLKQYLKSKKIKIKSEEDLEHLVEYFDTKSL